MNSSPCHRKDSRTRPAPPGVLHTKRETKPCRPPNESGFSGDPRYRRLLDWLDTMHRIEPRAWPYLWANGETGEEIINVVDLGARYDPAGTPPFLEPATSPWQTELEFSTDDKGNFASYTDEWDEWYSAWAPIENAASELVGGVGVDLGWRRGADTAGHS